MENKQMKQPTFEELAQAYTNTARELEKTKMELQAIRTDKILERLHTMMEIIEHKEVYPEKIVKLATWHIEQIMAKPKA